MTSQKPPRKAAALLQAHGAGRPQGLDHRTISAIAARLAPDTRRMTGRNLGRDLRQHGKAHGIGR